MRAADILSQRLPSVPKVDPNAPKTPVAADRCSSGKSFSYAGQSQQTISRRHRAEAGQRRAGLQRPTATGAPELQLRDYSANKAGAETKKPVEQSRTAAATPASRLVRRQLRRPNRTYA